MLKFYTRILEGEFMSSDFQEFLDNEGIIQERCDCCKYNKSYTELITNRWSIEAHLAASFYLKFIVMI